MDASLSIHAATYRDVQSIYQIQTANYDPGLWEDLCFLHHIITLGKSFVIKDASLGVIGYILCHNFTYVYDPPKLNKRFSNRTGDFLFIHDLCVHVDHHGKGLGKLLVQRVLELAKSEKKKDVFLVSLHKSIGFWKQMGFKAYVGDTAWDYHGMYGPHSQYMHLLTLL